MIIILILKYHLSIIVIINKGIPHQFRVTIWEYLMENPLRINKSLFGFYIKQMNDLKEDRLIKNDIDRSFFYLFKHKDFYKIKIEAEKVLMIWKVNIILRAKDQILVMFKECLILLCFFSFLWSQSNAIKYLQLLF